MAKPTIVYLHGFRSSPLSAKAQLFVQAVAALPPDLRPRLHVPQLQIAPAIALAEVAGWIEREAGALAPTELTLVGSSLGGYYATVLAERCGARAVLINPAIRPYDDLRRYAGVQDNLHTGERFEVTAAHFDQLAAMRVARITRPQRYFLLVRSGDELLDWREAVAFYAGAHQYVAGGGDHGWVDFGAEIPAVLRFAGCGSGAAAN
ncbi:MAG: esterase [Betaproteobacteria bacterium]|nr:esterase [Betaproteobacteria bacterium]